MKATEKKFYAFEHIPSVAIADRFSKWRNVGIV